MRNLLSALCILWLAGAASAAPVTITLTPGWNAVGFQYARLTTLDVPSQVAGAVFYDGAAYRPVELTLTGLNSGDGLRRGLWVYANAAATLTYDGTDEGAHQLPLRPGWNLVSVPVSAPLAVPQLMALLNGQNVPLGNVLLTRFYENGSIPVDPLAGGQVRPGRTYWIYANSPVSLGWPGSGPPPASSPLPSPVETWQLSSYLIGRTSHVDEGQGTVLMPNVIRRPDGTWRMYYNLSQKDDDRIRYADSSDLNTFVAQGTSLRTSASDEALLGGSSVVRLPDGRWRMYFRASPRVDSGPPQYSIRSAVSTDGGEFTREGVRIGIDAASQFELVGHGSVYELPAGGYGLIFSGNLKGDKSASDLFLATSTDGLSWGNFKLLYDGWHDPTVVKHEGRYYMYANYLASGTGRALSTDGVTWPAAPDAVQFVDEAGARFGLGKGIGDVGALSTSEGLRLFSNFQSLGEGVGGPTTDIVGWKLK